MFFIQLPFKTFSLEANSYLILLFENLGTHFAFFKKVYINKILASQAL